MLRSKRWLVTLVLVVACGSPGPAAISAPATAAATSARLVSPSPSSMCPQAMAPGPRSRASATFDSLHGQAVVFGGLGANPQELLAETWTNASGCWTQLHPATSPPGRFDAAIAFDPLVGRVLLYGGRGAGPTVPALFDAWTWDGTGWMPSTAAPPRINNPVATYDANLRKVILVGSSGTYTWDGSVFTLITSATGPLAAEAASMCFDQRTGRDLLFGGLEIGNGTNRTWTFDGVAWRQEQPAAVPPARYGALLVCASSHSLLVGGSSGGGAIHYSDMWDWNGATWIQLATAHQLSARAFAIGYNNGRFSMVSFGAGDRGMLFADSWKFDGQDWVQTAPGT